jgi:hypothetical protein
VQSEEAFKKTFRDKKIHGNIIALLSSPMIISDHTEKLKQGMKEHFQVKDVIIIVMLEVGDRSSLRVSFLVLSQKSQSLNDSGEKKGKAL